MSRSGAEGVWGMEHGWQMKCGPTLPSLAATVGSSITAVPIPPMQPQGFWSQDAQEPRLIPLGLKPTPTFSNGLHSGSGKSVHPEVGNYFPSLLSSPPSLSQNHFPLLSNSKSSIGSSYPNSSAVIDAGIRPSWLLSHNNANLNLRPDVDVLPGFSSQPTVKSFRCTSHGQCDDLDALRAVVTGTGSRNEDGRYISVQKGVNRAPQNIVHGEVCWGSNNHFVPETSLLTPSSVVNKQTPVVTECPRVFCMGACGDLLLSNTGLLGIFCSCHGLHMSVSNFCEHSGLSDVNPGYAVRMGSGESIAQWRKLYLQKFGIRAPDDHRGWDWPEGLLATSGLVKRSGAVAKRSKVFDLSSLFTSSAEPVKPAQPRNKVFSSIPQSVKESNDQMLKAGQWENTSDQHSFLVGFTGSSRWNSNTQTENPLISCPSSSGSVASEAGKEGRSRNDCQSRSLHFNSVSTRESSLASAFHNLQSAGTMTQYNIKDDSVLRGVLSSSIDLKLGQPSQKISGSRSTALMTTGSNIKELQTTTFQEQIIRNFGNSKVNAQTAQHLCCHPTSDMSKTREHFQLDFLNNALTTSNCVSHLDHLRDGLSNSFVAPVRNPPNNVAGGSNVHQRENNKGINESHRFSPWPLPSESHVNRSSLIDFSCCGSNGPMRPLDTTNLALQTKENSATTASCEHNYRNISTDSSFTIHQKQLDSSGLFVRDAKPSRPNICTAPSEKLNVHQKTSLLPDISCASNYTRGVHSWRSSQEPCQVNSSLVAGLHASSSRFTPLAVFGEPGLESGSLNKDVDAVNTHRSDESLRVLASRSVEQLFRGKPVSGSVQLNQSVRSHTDQRQQSEKNDTANLRVQNSFLDLGPSAKRHEHPFTFGHNGTLNFLPDVSGKKAGDIRKGTTAEDTNNWESSICMAFDSKVIHKYNQGQHNPLPEEQPSPRGENQASGCNILPRFFGGSCGCISGVCCCTVHTICSNRVQNSKVMISNGLKEQVRTEVVEAATSNVSRHADEAASNENTSIVKCHPKMKQRRGTLDCFDSRWRDVPSKVNPVSKLRCLDDLGKSLDNSGEAESNLKELGAEGIPTLNLIDDLQGKDLSNFSSGCSAPGVTQASIEVDRTDSCTVDAGATRYGDDQIVDQGSAIDKSCSSVDTNSMKSSEHVRCGNHKSSAEECLAVFPNGTPHDIRGTCNQRASISNQLQDLGDAGASFDEVSNRRQKNENGPKPRKRKGSVKWKILGASSAVADALPSGSPLRVSNVADHHTRISEDVLVNFQPNQDSTSTLDANVNEHSFKKRKVALSSVEVLPRKRDLNGICDIVECESDDQRIRIDNGDSVGIPENVAIKRLKPVKPFESNLKQVKPAEAISIGSRDPDSEKILKSSLKLCQESSLVSDENIGNQKAKPVATAKHGIICNEEIDLDQVKPRKIVPLSQVLKSCRRLDIANCKNDHPVASVRTGLRSSTRRGRQSNENLSSKGGKHDISVHETLEAQRIDDDVSVNNRSVSVEIEDNVNERYSSVQRCHHMAQLKPKKSRMRSLYELTMRGRTFISANSSLSQNVMCTSSTENELARQATDNSKTCDIDECQAGSRRFFEKPPSYSLISELDALCCVCGISERDDSNSLLECGHCLIKIHQACYGVSRVPKGDWYCRPCKTNSKDVACVLCGYGGGAMTRAFGSRNIVESLLKAWSIWSESHNMDVDSAEASLAEEQEAKLESANLQPSSLMEPILYNSIIGGLYNPSVKQWVHVVCGLWTPGTRCPYTNTMSAFDVFGVPHPKTHMVCYLCNRPGGSCIQCRLEICNTSFHPWCAHQKGLLQTEVDGVDHHKVGFYGRCLLHADHLACAPESDADLDRVDSETDQEEPTCARIKVYKGKKQGGGKHSSYKHGGKRGCLVTQVQLDAWLYINRQKLKMKRLPRRPVSDVDHDYKKEYARYKQAKEWKNLVVYKSGIHALGLYTSQFIPRGAMVVEYIGEIVGLRVADKRENEYLSGRRLQYKSACYFFKIDKEQIIDATCKGGIARFVNHSCEPNCVARVITVRSEKKVVFFAERDIYPGEEVTYDYHFNHEDEGKKIPCFCNSKNCRRYLN